jgi:antitoxin component of MazEF toxin-antitoxin module
MDIQNYHWWLMHQIQAAKGGNSPGFRIPRDIAESMRIRAGDALKFSPTQDGLLIRKVERRGKRYALADILDSFACAAEHPEVDFGGPKGKEAW